MQGVQNKSQINSRQGTADCFKTPPKTPNKVPNHVIIVISKNEVNQMGYATGSNRNQMTYWSIEDMVDEKSMVRIIDRFIEVQNFEELNFTRTTPTATGRRPYSPQMLAKLYVYGYENEIRSSRKNAGEMSSQYRLIFNE